MSDHDSLSLTAVIERFTDSERALEQVRRNLQALQLAEDIQTKAASALETVASQTGTFVGSVEGYLGELHRTQDLVQSALTTAREFLEGTDVPALQRELARLGDEVASIGQRLEASDKASAERWTSLEAQLRNADEARSEAEETRREADRFRQEAEAAKAELEALKNAIPDRTRRKMGLN